MPIDPNMAESALASYVKAGGNKEKFVSHFNSLKSDEKENFINEVASHYGVASSAQEAPVEKTFTPDIPQTSALEAFAGHAANAVPFQNEVSAAIEKGMGSLGAPEAYQDTSIDQLAKENMAQDVLTQKEHPIASVAGDLVGIAALAAPTAGMGIPGAVARVGLGAAQGADQAGEGNRGMGAIVGGVASTLGETLAATPKAARWIGEQLESFANKNAVRTLNFADKSLKKFVSTEQLQKLGRLLQNEGLVGTNAGAEVVHKQAQLASRLANAELTSTIEAIEKATPSKALLTKKQFIDNLDNKWSNNPDLSLDDTIQAIDELKSLTYHLGDNAKMTPSTIRQLAQKFENVTDKFNAANPKAGLKPFLNEASGELRGLNHQYAKASGLGDQFANASEKSWMLGETRKTTSKLIAKPYKGFSNAASHAYGDAKKVATKTVRPIMVTGPDTMSKILKAAANSRFGKFSEMVLNAAKRGPIASAANHYVMQSNPEYKAMVDKLSEESNEPNQ